MCMAYCAVTQPITTSSIANNRSVPKRDENPKCGPLHNHQQGRCCCCCCWCSGYCSAANCVEFCLASSQSSMIIVMMMMMVVIAAQRLHLEMSTTAASIADILPIQVLDVNSKLKSPQTQVSFFLMKYHNVQSNLRRAYLWYYNAPNSILEGLIYLQSWRHCHEIIFVDITLHFVCYTVTK